MAQYLLFLATVFFVGGILLGYYLHPAFNLSAGVAVVLFVLGWNVRRQRGLFIFFMLAALFWFGAAYEKSFFIVQRGTLPRKYEFAARVSAVEGVVVSEIGEKKASGRPKRSFTLSVERACVDGKWRAYKGKVLASVFRREAEARYGDRLRAQGKLHRPFAGSGRGRSSYREYLERQGIHWAFSIGKRANVEVLARGQGSRVLAGILSFRQRLRENLRKYLNPLEAAIMETMLLGATNDAPRYIQNLFMNTGTTHILAISGLHVTMMAVLFFILLKSLPFSRRAQYAATIILLLGYTVLTGSRPSAVRAFLMTSIFLASALVERESESLNSLALAALVILLINPFAIFDIGFQLSFVCVLGIILVYPLFWQLLEQRVRLEHGFFRTQLQSLTLSLAVWLTVAGFLVYYFGIISPVTIFANLVVIPASSLVLFLGTGLLLAGLFWPFLAAMFAVCLQVALSAMVFCVYLFSKVPWGYFWVSDIPLLGVGIYYAALALGFLALKVAVRRNSGYFPADENPGLG